MLMALMALPFSAAYAEALPATNDVQSVQQDATCKGVVKDATGEPVIGATVAVKGTTNATVTDLDGNFTLAGVKKGTVSPFLTSVSLPWKSHMTASRSMW